MTVTSSADDPSVGRTPSLGASLFVLGVMVALILFSVVQFGSEVAAGPLQVSMTLATLVAVAVAYVYGYRGAVISEAVSRSVSGTLGTMMVLLAIGALIGALYLCGTVAAFIYYGVALLSPQFYYVMVFIIASAVAVLLGSALTTVAAVGVPFVGLASVMGVEPAIAAGAALSGAILGDKTARISDTAVLTTASVGGASGLEHARSVVRTAIPTVAITAGLFLFLGLTGRPVGSVVDSATVQATVAGQFNVSLLAFVPIVLIFVLSTLQLSGFLCLMIPAVVAVILAAITQQTLISQIAGNAGLPYWEAVLRVGIDTLSSGFHLQSGDPGLDELFSGGGTAGMLSSIWLILVAASFAAVVDHTGMLRRAITPVISVAKGSARLVLVTMLTSIGLNAVAADPYVSIVLVSRMFRADYILERLRPVTLTTAIADSGTTVSYLIPWNVNGALVAATLGVGAVVYAPYTFLGYLSPIVTAVIAIVFLGRRRLAGSEDAAEVYGKEPIALPLPEHSA